MKKRSVIKLSTPSTPSIQRSHMAGEQDRQWEKSALLALGLILALSCGVALAQVSIGGTDASGQMKDVQTLVTTVQNIGFKWIAPLIGGGLAIIGIFQIDTRRLGMGILALCGGGALFAVEKIANSLSHIAGN